MFGMMALALRCQLVELVLLLHVVMQNEVAESKENEASGERDVLKPQTPTGTWTLHGSCSHDGPP